MDDQPIKLSEAELASLRCCPSNKNQNPEPGNRTAYIKARLKNEGFVQPLWVLDDDEIFFTWQRTLKGDAAVKAYDEAPS